MNESHIWTAYLVELGPSLENYDKNIWSEEEMAMIYAINNGWDGTSTIDTKCGSCRRHAIARCRNIWEIFKKQQRF